MFRKRVSLCTTIILFNETVHSKLSLQVVLILSSFLNETVPTYEAKCISCFLFIGYFSVDTIFDTVR